MMRMEYESNLTRRQKKINDRIKDEKYTSELEQRKRIEEENQKKRGIRRISNRIENGYGIWRTNRERK